MPTDRLLSEKEEDELIARRRSGSHLRRGGTLDLARQTRPQIGRP